MASMGFFHIESAMYLLIKLFLSSIEKIEVRGIDTLAIGCRVSPLSFTDIIRY